MTEVFTVTENHTKLLRRLNLDFDNAPLVNQKRPYGNSDIALDIVEILEFTDPAFDRAYAEEHYSEIMDLHTDIFTVLQIMLDNLSVHVGTYTRGQGFNAKWRMT